MTWTRRLLGIVAVLALVGQASPAVGQETLDLQVKLSRGEVLYHSFRANFEFTASVLGRRSTSSFQVDARAALRVLDVETDGTMLIEDVLEDARLTSAGRTESTIEGPVTLKVRPDGRVVERQTGDYLEEDYPLALPGRPVRVGETWNRQRRLEESGFTGQAAVTYTLAGVETAGDERQARITYRIDGRVTGTEAGQLLPGMQARSSGTMRGNGEVYWSVVRGRVVRAREDLTLEVVVEATEGGQTVRLSMSTRMNTRRDPLPAGNVTPPAVAAELLISPGKGIGPVTLDMTAADIESRLGSATPGGEVGLRAPGVSWPGGLHGYLDPDDKAKVVGLRASGPRYRTDKGIGFGSSQGAVLVAYGMSPARLDLSIPDLGGVRMLIYDDLGIAFAITSDKQHAAAGPSHAPVGAVDWITVFPAGGAGKIFTLP